MVTHLSGSDPGFTYILQALSGHSQLTSLPESPTSPFAAPSHAEGPGRERGGAGLLPSSVRRTLDCNEDGGDATHGAGREIGEPCVASGGDEPSQWCYSSLAGGKSASNAARQSSQTACPSSSLPAFPTAPACRLDLECRLLAALEDSALVLTPAGVCRLVREPDAALMLAPGQTAVLRFVWRREGSMVVDRLV